MAHISQKPGEITFTKAIKDYFRGYIDFKGRTTRAGYWWVYLIIYTIKFFMAIFILICLFSLFAVIFSESSYMTPQLERLFRSYFLIFILYSLYSLTTILPDIAINIRRYRDAGLRGRGALVIWLCYPILLVFSNLLPGLMWLLLIFQFNAFFFIVTILPTDILTIDTDNKFLRFFFRQKDIPEKAIDADLLDF